MHTDLLQESSVTLKIIIFEKVPCKYYEFDRTFLVNWSLSDSFYVTDSMSSSQISLHMKHQRFNR